MKNALIAGVIAAVVASSTAGAAGVRPGFHIRSRHPHIIPTVHYVWDLPVAAGATVTDTVSCPARSLATGGGVESPGDVRASYPAVKLLTPYGWTATVRNDTGAAMSMKVYVLCVSS